MLNIEVSWVWGLGGLLIWCLSYYHFNQAETSTCCKKDKEGNSLKNMQDNDKFIIHIKNCCDTLFRNFELKLWQDPDQEHPPPKKKRKNLISCISIPKISICIHIHQCDSVLKLDLQISKVITIVFKVKEYFLIKIFLNFESVQRHILAMLKPLFLR